MTNPYMGELRIMSFNFAPKYWAQCNGQLLGIQQNQALFSLLGTTYGGNGVNNFALPDLRTRVPTHMGSGWTLGEITGENSHTLLITEIPQHLHFLKVDATHAGNTNTSLATASTALGQTYGKPSSGSPFDFNLYSTATTPLVQMSPAALAVAGGSQPHENRQPFLALNICISLSGIFPSRN